MPSIVSIDEAEARPIARVPLEFGVSRSKVSHCSEIAGQTGAGGYWHRDMLWFGPGGVGANFTYPGFDRDHRIPFLTAFPDRVGGNHFCRFGDGDYVCSGGWPSMTMTHRGPYLGVAPTERSMTLRVMNFWRVADGSIRENWVLLDLPDLLAQMGADVFA